VRFALLGEDDVREDILVGQEGLKESREGDRREEEEDREEKERKEDVER